MVQGGTYYRNQTQIWCVNIRVFAENFGWVRFLVVCFLYKTDPKPTKKIFAVEKSGLIATFNLFFLGLGWPWVWGVGRFHNNIGMFFNPTEFGKSQTSSYGEA